MRALCHHMIHSLASAFHRCSMVWALRWFSIEENIGFLYSSVGSVHSSKCSSLNVHTGKGNLCHELIFLKKNAAFQPSFIWFELCKCLLCVWMCSFFFIPLVGFFTFISLWPRVYLPLRTQFLIWVNSDLYKSIPIYDTRMVIEPTEALQPCTSQDIRAFKTAAKIEKLKSAYRMREKLRVNQNTGSELEHDLKMKLQWKRPNYQMYNKRTQST